VLSSRNGDGTALLETDICFFTMFDLNDEDNNDGAPIGAAEFARDLSCGVTVIADLRAPNRLTATDVASDISRTSAEEAAWCVLA